MLSVLRMSPGMAATISSRCCWRHTIALLLLLLCFEHTLGYSSYVSSSPNGNSIGGGLGHTSSGGGGARNSYGNAFSAAGHQWTRALCLAGAWLRFNLMHCFRNANHQLSTHLTLRMLSAAHAFVACALRLTLCLQTATATGRPTALSLATPAACGRQVRGCMPLAATPHTSAHARPGAFVWV